MRPLHLSWCLISRERMVTQGRMRDDDYGFGSGMGYEDEYGDGMGGQGKQSMLGHVINLLKALIGILDIISDNFEKKD